tara:strand:+ start:207 stop:419 length:213 start_codon:yes stop_codon:yes gene_type:complete
MYVYTLLLIILIGCIVSIENFVSFPIGISTRNTRGMTYDMRCTPYIKKKYVPWGYSTIYPNKYGKCLELV